LGEIRRYLIDNLGMFEMDNKEGEGRLFLSNGEVIEGLFKKDCINGHAKFTNLLGEEVEGYW